MCQMSNIPTGSRGKITVATHHCDCGHEDFLNKTYTTIYLSHWTVNGVVKHKHSILGKKLTCSGCRFSTDEI